METKANPVVVGIFTLAAIVAAFTFIYWLGRYGEQGELTGYRVVFTDDVSGLSEGSPVLFNGIKVGQVGRITLAPHDPTQVIANIRISASIPVNVDTTAQLQAQGITGGSVLMLRSGRANAPRLSEAWGDPDTAPLIFAERSGFQNLMEGAQKLLTRVDDVAQRIDRLISVNETAVTRTITNVESFSQALAERSDSVGKLIDDAAEAARGIAVLSKRLEPVAVRLEGLISAINPEDVGKTLANLREFSDTVAGKKDQFSVFMDEASSAATRLNALAEQLRVAGEDVGKFAKALDSDQMTRTLTNVETFTTSLSEKSEKVEQFIDDAAAIAKQLRGTSERIDTLVARVDTMVGKDGDGFIQNLSETAKSFRTLADNLNARLDVISADIQRFSGRGLRDVEAFVSEGRRALSSIERVLTEFERNPSRFILQGGSNVREYNARR